jgi:type IX secretion system PorP/SprF family membrane protein
MKKYLVVVIFSTLIPLTSFSQQYPILTQYNWDQYLVNPAAAGVCDYMPITLIFRKNWVGVDDSPSLQMLSTSLPLTNMGAGLKIFNFSQGPLRHTGVQLTYAYHIPFGDNGPKLSFGLTGSFYQYYLNKEELMMEDPSDPVLLGDVKQFVPDANVGTMLYDEKYFVGFTITSLFQGKINLGNEGVAENKKVRHYFLNGGYNFSAGENIILQPSVLLKMIEAGVFQADINFMMVFNKMINFGVMYRSGDAVGIQVGYQNKNILFGYNYDIAVSDVRTQTSGSHEIIFIYKIHDLFAKK